LAGCATSPPAYSWPRTGDPIVDGKTAIELGPERDRVLWQYRTALAAMRLGRFDEARPLLDDALATLGGIHGPDRDARRARGMFSAEGRKNFIGEPYERVMAYYYRGILFWMDGEIDNARACFRSAQFMDSDTENREYANDYVLLEYLDGFATAKLGGDGSDALARARSFARLATPPELNPDANLLFFVEFGRGPTKYATGQHGEQLRFLPGKSSTGSVRIRLGQRTIDARPYDDLNYQAMTRGGRLMDHV
jgi:tetratricopeptide (TPR) repeat protein